ncbi:MAG: restriction endonuclease subunit S, partial [Bacteroidetes bacterium]|nr:restriction endonuclease subunit S [Bacteroidota bacterium]
MEYKLKDIIQFKPGYPFKKEDMTEVGIDLIKIGNLKNNRVIIPSDVKIKENIKFKDYVIKKNDILMALTGDPVFKGNIQTWVGRTSIYVEDKISYLNQRICKLIPNEKILINDYLYYWLIRFDKTYEIAGLFRGSANQANISHKEVGEMLIDVPSLTIQRKVSKVLSNIDNKIDLNNKINKNLQAMASNVINSYFDKCDDREKYNGIIKFIKGKKPKDVIDYYEVGYEKYLTIACLNGEENKYANIDNMFMTDHDILMVMDGASSGDTYFSTYGIVGSTLSKIV